ncbi:hypothetical protein AVEN_159772-1 [Araneus ventricosus]|uniref:Tc1-like transposase DDE domain-containing protein n=1 Tax=Araneus ventricosus TaxID=182803 RepID=A0A4Y2D9A0_ARAVE|nr:hypothetical protein AVEN_159772-1 [Araneus ventricosus]
MDKVRLLPSCVQGLLPTKAALSSFTMNRSPIVLDMLSCIELEKRNFFESPALAITLWGKCSLTTFTLILRCSRKTCCSGSTFEVFDHPVYSPDLAPSDYQLFQHLERFLEKQYFPSNDGVYVDGCHTLVPLCGGESLRHRCI